jgi:hypothetical protein
MENSFQLQQDFYYSSYLFVNIFHFGLNWNKHFRFFDTICKVSGSFEILVGALVKQFTKIVGLSSSEQKHGNPAVFLLSLIQIIMFSVRRDGG